MEIPTRARRVRLCAASDRRARSPMCWGRERYARGANCRSSRRELALPRPAVQSRFQPNRKDILETKSSPSQGRRTHRRGLWPAMADCIPLVTPRECANYFEAARGSCPGMNQPERKRSRDANPRSSVVPTRTIPRHLRGCIQPPWRRISMELWCRVKGSNLRLLRTQQLLSR